MAFPLSTRITDTLIDAAIWNADIVDNLNNRVMHLISVKTLDQTLSTTLQDITGMGAAVAANERWRFEFLVTLSASAGDTLYRWTFPSGGTIVGLQLGAVSGAFGTTLDLQTTSPTGTSGFTGNSNGRTVMFPILYTNGSTAGNVQLQAAGTTASPVAKAYLCHVWGVKVG